jgi:hypothetical protein
MEYISKSFMILFLLVALAGCGTTTQKSVRLDREITINGDLTDWPSSPGNGAISKILVRTFDDGKFLYLSLVVNDPKYARTILAGGLETWIDPQGGKQKTLGILFPVGMGDLDYRRKDVDRKLRDPLETSDVLKVMTEDLKLVNEKGEIRRVRVEDLREEGFEAQASYSNGVFIYEMKIPMEDRKTLTCSIVPGKNRVISLGLEAAGMASDPRTPSDSQAKPGESGSQAGMPSGGGMRQHGGMGRGRMGPKSAGREANSSDNVAGFKKLKTWMRIVLSE